MKSFTFPDPPDPTMARGRKYTVTTEALGTAVTMNGHWLYEPSVLLPSPLTGNRFLLLLNRNKNSGQGQKQGEVITVRSSLSSSDPVNFGPEAVILDNTNPSDLPPENSAKDN